MALPAGSRGGVEAADRCLVRVDEDVAGGAVDRQLGSATRLRDDCERLEQVAYADDRRNAISPREDRAWAVGDEPARAMPRRRSRGSVAVKDGGRSLATTIAGRSRPTVGWPVPASRRAIRSPTSMTSAARAASSSFSSDRSCSANDPAAACTAAIASSWASLIRSVAIAARAGSRAIAACASKIAASSGCPSSRTRREIDSSSAAAAAEASARRLISPVTPAAVVRPPAGASAGSIRTHAARATPGAAARP